MMLGREKGQFYIIAAVFFFTTIILLGVILLQTVTVYPSPAHTAYDRPIEIVKNIRVGSSTLAEVVLANETARCFGDIEAELRHLDMMLILDRSGSMGDEIPPKIEGAKDAAGYAVNLLTLGHDRAGLVSFNEAVTLDQPLTYDFDAVKDAIEILVAGGWTNIGDAIDMAKEEFVFRGDPHHTWVIVLLSDGMANRGPDPVVEAQEAAGHEITIYSIGLGSDADEATLRAIADATGGEYYYAPTADDLEGIYQGIRHGLSGITSLPMRQAYSRWTSIVEGSFPKEGERVDLDCYDYVVYPVWGHGYGFSLMESSYNLTLGNLNETFSINDNLTITNFSHQRDGTHVDMNLTASREGDVGLYNCTFYVYDALVSFPSLNVLFIGGGASPNEAQDQPFIDIIEAEGHTVTYHTDDNNYGDVSAYDVIVVSKSVNSSQVSSLQNAPVGILTTQAYTYDELRLAGNADPGLIDTDIYIANNAHYITRPYPVESIDVYSLPSPLTVNASWGADVNNAGTKYPADGSDYLGYSSASGASYRVANKFPLTNLPSGANVTKVELIFYVQSAGDTGAGYGSGSYGWSTDVPFDSSNSNSLDCSGGYMVVGDGTPNWGSTTGTISFWVKFDSVTSGRPWGQADNMETRLSSQKLVLDWGATGQLTSSTTFTTGKWYFMAIVWNETADTLRLYVGDQTNSPTLDAENVAWTAQVSTVGVTQNNFMASRAGYEPVDGRGDDLRYWNTARTLAALQGDYNRELSGTEANLVSYYQLDGNFTDSANLGHLTDIHPYGGDGQADPETDSGTNMYSLCASGTEYLNDSKACQTTGEKTIDLGPQACIDVMNAKFAVNRFSVGWHEEGDNSKYAQLREYTSSSPPKLRITYMPDFKWMTGWRNGVNMTAYGESNPALAAILQVEQDEADYSGSPAPERRVFYAAGDGYALTTYGRDLFRRAFDWAAHNEKIIPWTPSQNLVVTDHLDGTYTISFDLADTDSNTVRIIVRDGRYVYVMATVSV